MARSILGYAAWLTLVGSAAAGAPLGCGGGAGAAGQATHKASVSGDAGQKPGMGSGVAEAGSEPASGDEAGAFGDGGVSCIDGGAGPKGTQLVKSSTASILGLTDDDQVVYVDTASNTLFTVPAAGGAATSLGSTEGSVGIASKAVFDWTGLSQDGTTGTVLQVWTSGGGMHSLASGASLAGVADSSADGTKVVFFDNASGSTADLFVAGIDGSAKTKLAAGIFWTANCMPEVSFLGTSIVLGYCTAVPSGMGSNVGTLAVYVGAAGAGVTLSTNALLSFQSAGTNIVYNAGGALLAADATSGATTVIDAAGGNSATFSHDGQSVFYLATDGSIKRSSIASPSPAILVAGGGFGTVWSLSPDDQWLLASKNRDPNSGNSDIYIASAATAGPANAILSSTTGSFYGSAFTADSSRVLYVDNTMNGAGDYHVAPTTGGPGVQIATQMWIGFATTGTKVVFQDNFVPSVGLNAQGIADIESIDVSAAAPTSSLLVNQADPNLYFTSAGSSIVYSLTFCAVGSQGIWVMPTP
jgi:hypothetical protein